jgi:hypothetical protein
MLFPREFCMEKVRLLSFSISSKPGSKIPQDFLMLVMETTKSQLFTSLIWLELWKPCMRKNLVSMLSLDGKKSIGIFSPSITIKSHNKRRLWLPCLMELVLVWLNQSIFLCNSNKLILN